MKIKPSQLLLLVSLNFVFCFTSVAIAQQNRIEVVQSVQSFDQDVPLIAGKKTLVRVYLDNAENSALKVTGQLEVTRVNSGKTQVIDSNNSIDMADGQNDSLAEKHDDIRKSLNFVLPAEWTAPGLVSFRLANILSAADKKQLSCTSCARFTLPVSFHSAPALKVRVIYFAYNLDGVSPFAYPSDADLTSIESWLTRTYPTSQIIISHDVVDAAVNKLSGHFKCYELNAALAGIRFDEVTNDNVDPLTHYYGLVSDKYYLMSGCSIVVPNVPDARVVASGPAGNPARHADVPSIYWDKSAIFTGWYAGHEIAHTFGRAHPGTCGELPEDSDFPYIGGFLSNSPEKYVGLDVGNNPDIASAVALPGLKWTDMMSYCANKWISQYTFDAILKRLYAENGLDPNGGPGLASPGELQEKIARDSKTGFINIIAFVNFTKSVAEFNHVQKSESPYFQLAGEDGGATIRAMDHDAKVIRTYRAMVYKNTDVSPGEDETAAIQISIPYDDRISTLELVVSEKIKAIYATGGSRAAVSDLLVKNAGDLNKEEFSMMTSATQAEGATKGILVKWKAAGEGVTYTVAVSTNKGHTWNTIAVGLTQHYLAISPVQVGLTEGQDLLVRVRANDGIRSTAVDTKSITVGKQE